MTREEIERLLLKLRDKLQLSSSNVRQEGDSLSQASENLADPLHEDETASGDAAELADRIAEAIRMLEQFESGYRDEKTVH